MTEKKTYKIKIPKIPIPFKRTEESKRRSKLVSDGMKNDFILVFKVLPEMFFTGLGRFARWVWDFFEDLNISKIILIAAVVCLIMGHEAALPLFFVAWFFSD